MLHITHRRHEDFLIRGSRIAHGLKAKLACVTRYAYHLDSIPEISLFLRLVTLPLLSSLAFISPAAPDDAVMHLHLKSSAPQADAMVHELDRIELVFSESPQDGSVSARLLDAEGKLVETPKAEPHGDEGVAFAVSLTDGVDPGSYTVSWRAMGSDGHVVRGDFGFVFMNHGDGVQATPR